MIKLLLKIWPAFTPIILFGAWYFLWGRHIKARAEGEEVTPEGKLWRLALASTLVLIVAGIVWIGATQKSNTSDIFVPASYKDGVLTPSHMVSPADADKGDVK
jgi:hypothetical protein